MSEDNIIPIMVDFVDGKTQYYDIEVNQGEKLEDKIREYFSKNGIRFSDVEWWGVSGK